MPQYKQTCHQARKNQQAKRGNETCAMTQEMNERRSKLYKLVHKINEGGKAGREQERNKEHKSLYKNWDKNALNAAQGTTTQGPEENAHTRGGKEILGSNQGMAQSTGNNAEPKGRNNELAKIPKMKALAEDTTNRLKASISRPGFSKKQGKPIRPALLAQVPTEEQRQQNRDLKEERVK